MAESDGGEASPGPGSRAGGGASPDPRPPRPQLTKSRTISGSAAASFAAADRGGGGGGGGGRDSILVRRSSTAPLPPPAAAAGAAPAPRRLTVAVDDPSYAAPNGGVLDRDWCYPSFLGPHASRPRPPRQQQQTPTSADRRNSTNPTVPPRVAVSQREEEKILASVVKRPPLLEERRPLPPPPPLPRAPRFDLSPYLPLLLVVTVTSSALAIWQWIEVMALQEKIRSCSDDNPVDSVGTAKMSWIDRDHGSAVINSGNWNLAPSSTILAFAVPLFLFKYVDQLRRRQANSMRVRSSEEEVPLKKRIAYMVDVFFSGHPYAKLLALLLATIILIASGGIALYAVSGSGFLEALWLSWTFVADSGNHADQVGLGPRIVSVSISSGGMLVFATMLGLVSDAISEKVDSWRKGKSEVIEINHILILGWSDKLGSLLKQLAIANKSIGGGVVVVLAERDKEEMEMDIAKLEFDFMGTSVICRSGSPLILADLKKVSVSKARAIIVLASDENADQSDARALRVVLSLTGVKEGLRGHVVVEMSDLDNEPLVKLVGGELIETVVAHDVIGRLMIQCALQPGLAQIWEDILGFENAEFYIKRWPELDGMRFGDVLISFPDAVSCGVKVASKGGKILMNPDDDYVLREGDEVLVIAEDDDTYAPAPLPEVNKGFLPNIPTPPKYPEKILFCGWRRDIHDMIMVLEAFLAPGSELWMFNEVPEKEREIKLTDGGLDICGLTNIKLVHKEGNAVIRRHLESLPLETFDSILILADESVEDSIVHSDSRSLATLLLIREIQSKRLPSKELKSPLRYNGFCHSSWIREMQHASDKSIIISEILDSRTRNLVSVSKISDYVLSNELVSMALAMVAEDKQINRVLEELFAEEGNEMCIRSAEFYLYEQEELSFFDIMVRARERDEIVIGYRLANTDQAIINPEHKSVIRKWSLDDVFVVISKEC
ncbi:probable ion channel POLLUX isoform X2 [Phragmites australis]|uniref:probable ion channel POLLUX isoform X2 n=1 Tax=Phragmites australis TaxID=29695 RepID=UPI002D799B59|nr:probable ion channel POLLUX isoform X2 [Phragmites australis]